jgi:uncharacterized membrane protein YidH (DUF202 family)
MTMLHESGKMKVLGIILITAGLLMLLLRQIQYTKKEKVVDVGPVEITKKEPKTITWPYYAGAIAIGAGIVVLLVGTKRIKD